MNSLTCIKTKGRASTPPKDENAGCQPIFTTGSLHSGRRGTGDPRRTSPSKVPVQTESPARASRLRVFSRTGAQVARR